MNMSITTKNFTLTPAIKQHIEHAMAPIAKHFHPLPTPLHVTLTCEKIDNVAEGHMHLPGHKDIKARCVAKDMYVAISGLAKKLDEQALKHKSIMKDHGHSHGHHGEE